MAYQNENQRLGRFDLLTDAEYCSQCRSVIGKYLTVFPLYPNYQKKPRSPLSFWIIRNINLSKFSSFIFLIISGLFNAWKPNSHCCHKNALCFPINFSQIFYRVGFDLTDDRYFDLLLTHEYNRCSNPSYILRIHLSLREFWKACIQMATAT